jgi:hypothetical protein
MGEAYVWKAVTLFTTWVNILGFPEASFHVKTEEPTRRENWFMRKWPMQVEARPGLGFHHWI